MRLYRSAAESTNISMDGHVNCNDVIYFKAILYSCKRGFVILFYNLLGYKKIIGLIYIRDMCIVLINRFIYIGIILIKYMCIALYRLNIRVSHSIIYRRGAIFALV